MLWSATLWNQQRCYRLPTMTICRSKMKSSVWRCEKLPHISFLLKHSHKDKNIGAFYFKLCEFLQFFLHLLKKYTSDPGNCTHVFKQTVQPSSFFILKDLHQRSDWRSQVFEGKELRASENIFSHFVMCNKMHIIVTPIQKFRKIFTTKPNDGPKSVQMRWVWRWSRPVINAVPVLFNFAKGSHHVHEKQDS